MAKMTDEQFNEAAWKLLKDDPPEWTGLYGRQKGLGRSSVDGAFEIRHFDRNAWRWEYHCGGGLPASMNEVTMMRRLEAAGYYHEQNPFLGRNHTWIMQADPPGAFKVVSEDPDPRAALLAAYAHMKGKA